MTRRTLLAALPAPLFAPLVAPLVAAPLFAAPLAACGPRGREEPPRHPSRTPDETGIASYYADSLAGNLTANGDRYDPQAFTAAHRTLPFGTVVDVVRRDGRSVRVRINDRGPFVKGRVIDLSRKAATTLGMIREGIVDVGLYIVR